MGKIDQNLGGVNTQYRGIREGIGERLRQLRGKRNQEEAAKEWGVAVNTLRRYEAGTSMPDAERVSIICKHEGASAEWLINGASLDGTSVREGGGIYKNPTAWSPDPQILGEAIAALEAKTRYRDLSAADKARALIALYTLKCTVPDDDKTE